MSVIPGLESDILAYYFQGGTVTVPRIGQIDRDAYINLCSASPGESGVSANELFTRQILDAWTLPFVESGVVVMKSAEQISWVTGSPGTATHFLLSNTSSTSHRFYDSLATPVNFSATDTVRFRSGRVVVSLSGLFSYEGGFGASAPAYAMMRNLLYGDSYGDEASASFGLSTTAPNVDGTNVTEPTGGSYARVGISFGSTLFSGTSPAGASPTTLTSTNPIVWPTATASWGTITHWVAYDASSGGDMLYYGTIDNPAEVINGVQPRFDTGDLVFSCD